MISTGKRFEQNLKKSIPANIFVFRIPDAAGSFQENTNLRFGIKNPCDFFLYHPINKQLYAWELKTTGGTSVSFDKSKECARSSNMIHWFQIRDLTNMQQKFQIKAGFLLNFRKTHHTYYLPIETFQQFIQKTKKTSINESDLLQLQAIVIPSRLLRVNEAYDLAKLFV